MIVTADRSITPNQAGSILYHCLQQATDHSKTIKRVISSYGELSIRDYTGVVLEPPVAGLQNIDDFLGVVQELAHRDLGPDIGARLARDLKKNPVTLTANHQGVDCFAQSAQGSLLFALAQQAHYPSINTALILSCGNIPLDNITYPQGLLIYALLGEHAANAPKKLPVLSNKLRRWAVSVAPGYDQEMVKRSLAAVSRMRNEQVIGETSYQALNRFLNEDYCDSSLLALSEYSDQAMLLNDRMWRKILPATAAYPQLVYLELEKVVARLVEFDLRNSQSLLWKVLFDESLREQTFKALEGNRVCWSGLNGSSNDSLSATDKQEKKWGTHFFWGISPNGRKYPLTLSTGSAGIPILRGRDNKGSDISHPLNTESIIELQHKKQILPSVFTCFLTLSLARGINCLGGYYQAEYLPEMQMGLVAAMEQVGIDPGSVQKVRAVPTNRYLSGMQTVMSEVAEGNLVPAGPIELLAGGGLDEHEIAKILATKVKDAHLASMVDTIPDIAPWVVDSSQWKSRVAKDCHDYLIDELVVK